MEEEKLLRLEGAVENIVFRNEDNGYTVLEISDGEEYITAVGVMPLVSAGDTVTLLGSFTEHKSYGRQFAAQTCEVARPDNSADILRYLASGAVKGVGPSTARRLVDEFGEATLEVMEKEPERVAMLRGISRAKALEFSAQLKSDESVRALMLYLGGFGISNTVSIKVFKQLGAGAVEQIKENPYQLCMGDFGISFQTADVIAMKESFRTDSEARLRAGITYILRHNEGNGHTCLPRKKLEKMAAEFLRIGVESISDCMEAMIFDRTLVSETMAEKEFIFLQAMHLTEVAISAALTEGLLGLTGGPGTGKTTTLNAIIKILQSRGQKVLLAAPTGRAAQRMSELTGGEAKTIHRLLEVSWDNQDKPVFSKNERNQLKGEALIIDEVSMVDVSVFESVLRALPLGCRLILVGDSDQLPSVGAGNVLGDLIEGETIPVVRLHEIFRQAQKSLIITNAHRIVNGEMPILNAADKDFFFLKRNYKNEVSELIADLCSVRLPKAYGYSAFESIQVLSPSKKGELGTAELNHRLQARLNPAKEGKSEAVIGSRTFRVGDKVMQIKNNYDIRWEKEDGEIGEGIFNGDIGIIKAIDRKSKRMWVDFFDKSAAISFENASELDFAYAITVHKSQGNEFDCVIIPMFPGPSQLYYRNLLYTAVTRAKKTLILVGNPHTVEIMVNNNRQTKRYTGLKHFLRRDFGIYTENNDRE